MRIARRVVALGAVLSVLATSRGVTVRADGDTWGGTWARTEVSGNLVLTQTGNVVTGSYTWNDGSGHVSGTVSGSSLSGTFDETHYRGSFDLTLSGRQFTGSYRGVNKDTDGDISGPFSGTCTAGSCLANGSSSAPSAAPGESPSASPTLTPTQAEALLLAALSDDNLTKLSQLVLDRGYPVKSQFEEAIGTPSPKVGTVLVIAGGLAQTTMPGGLAAYPSVNALMPVILQMCFHASTDADPESRAQAESAALRLVAFLIQADTAASTEGGQ